METNKLPVAAQPFPAEIKLEAGKTYAWCTCGLSEKQPFCDGKHKASWYEKDGETVMPFKSLKFTAEKNETVWLCQCKQTKNQLFCDGSHNAIIAKSN
ncbi:MAG: CDGSH iron-sulfur domain-containing protein [Chitinophagaceae bacterium]|nr:CDGSH iron-sulfur domain-containing protein [Chitinophagaceae bacterium]